MRTVMQKGAARVLALFLCLTMLLGMVPASMAAGTEATDADTQSRIVHLDMGRKYFTPEWIKALIQEISALGYTELELDFSNNEGFRFSLPADEMQIEVGDYETVLMEVEPEEEPQVPETADVTEPDTDAAAAAETDVANPVQSQAPETAETEEDVSEPVQASEPAGEAEAEPAPQYKEVEVYNSKTVDLTNALSAEYITAEEMEEIIACADEAGIEIVPLLNSPGHMGAILNVFPEYRWTDDLGRTSNSTIDLENKEAVRFAQGVVRAYAQWFAKQGCTTFNIGADEFANDIGGAAGAVMGLNYIYTSDQDVYSALIDYINDLAVIVQSYDMTPRAFNDSFCYKNDTTYAPTTDIQICYWSSGWGAGYDLAKASTLERQGYDLINTNGDYYYVLGKDDCWDNSSSYKYDFSNNTFAGGSTISNPVGSMFCIWSDYPDAETEQKVAEKIRVPLRIMAARMQDQEVSAGTVDTSVIAGGFNADGTINTDVPSNTVGESGIEVTAPDLTSIKVNETTVDALQGTYVAYDITLNNGSYTGSAEVSIPLPNDWNYSEAQLSGFVLSADGKVEYATGSLDNGVYTFIAPHFSTVGVAVRAGKSEIVTLAVGEEKTYSLTGKQEITSDPDSRIASVSATYQAGVGSKELRKITRISELVSGGKYLIENQHAGKLLTDEKYGNMNMLALNGSVSADSEELWTITSSNDSYTIQNTEGQYLKIGGSSAEIDVNSQSLSLDYKEWETGYWPWEKEQHSGWYIGQGTEYLNDYQAKKTMAAGYNAEQDTGSLWNLYQLIETPAEGSTTVTITGKSVGTTTAVVGDTVYEITVTSEDLSKVEPVLLEYFITNSKVYETDSKDSASSKKVYATDDSIATENGVALNELAPNVGYGFYDGTKKLEYWKTSLLPEGQHQIEQSGSEYDKSLAGETVLRLRYWNGRWEYQNSAEQWVEIKNTDQLVAYYMMKTTVTPQIDTYGKDWGFEVNQSDGENKYTGDAGQVALSFAVVYPGGSISPSTDNVYKQTTTVFNFWENRDIGIVMVKENDIYEASEIVLVSGKRQVKHSSYGQSTAAWYGDENITWDTKYNWDTGKWELNTSNVVWTKESGTEPVIQGSEVEGGTWTERDTAILVLIYLEVKTSEDNLKVQYIDDSASGKVAFEYDVAVRNTAGQDPITFVNGIKNSGKMQIGEITLSDNAYIIDATGQQQGFNKDIASVPELAGTQYATGQYNYVRAVISNDGKTLELHYQKKAADYQFVLDYGLPIVITAEDLGISNANGITFQTSATASYGSLSCDNSQHTITYTPTEFLDGTDTFNLEIKYQNGTSQREAIDIIPASTVYYEDSFVAYSDKWEIDGVAESNRVQTTSKLGSGDIYGYDAAYAKDTTYSGGSAHKVTLGSGETATARFTFHGTGFQLVSMTDNTSGCITVHVEGSGVDKYYFVDCYYQNNGELYQVPVMKVDDLTLGTYTVTVTAGYLSIYDRNNTESSTFVLDGIRIYKPVGDYENYKQDNEGSATYSEIRNILIAGWDKFNKVYVDTLETSTSDVTMYLKVGPNNEVYLKDGDQITFTVPEGGSIVQIGAKLVSGSEMTFTVNSQKKSITSAAEMYYLLDKVEPGDEITITATGEGILSLTNLKLVSGS